MSDRDRLTNTLARAMGRDDPLRLARDRIAALDAEVARLRRERNERVHPETVDRLRLALRVYAEKDASKLSPHLVVSMAIGVIADAANGWPSVSGNRLHP